MKKLLLTVMIILPMMLSAQTVSNLQVIPGAAGTASTVTFDVEWVKADLDPISPWLDSMWVFVDYNENGAMTRLEVSGGTLTAHSATTPSPQSPDAGTVIKIADNDRGVWVVGDARTSAAGSFSAKVQLFTKKTDITIAGACAYASSYPPVGAWLDDAKIGFTGTPIYEVTLTPSGGGADETVEAGSTFLLPCDYSMSSFTDATGAPGIIDCLAPASLTLTANRAAICAGETVTLTASASGGISYSIDNNAWQATPAFTVAPTSNSSYTLYVRTSLGCPVTVTATASDAAMVTVNAAPVAPTSLASNTTMFCNSEFTAATLTAGGGSAGSYEWGTGNTVGNNPLGTTAGNTYAVSPNAPTTYWVRMKGAGACSTTATEGMKTAIWVYTEPVPVGYFGSYNPNSASPATYVTLFDGRDGKIYPVVKIGGRWIMARNLNYQGTTGNPSLSLTWQANAGSPSTALGSNTALIGHFWCPSGSGSGVITSTRASCDVWGALYSWETAMSADGKGAWTEAPSTYNTGAANSAAAKANHGRITSGTGRGGRGICPPDWHVPTDYEWGIIFDAMESSVSTAHQTASVNDAWYGVDAGLRSRSKCKGAANDMQANWLTGQGSDDYGFRALPTGYRLADGSYFVSQGFHANFWSSSAYDASYAWRRDVRFNYDTVYRNDDLRSQGYSVRCIMD